MSRLVLAFALLVPGAALAGNVERLADGAWNGATYGWGPKTTRTDKNLWVDLSVANLCYAKSVGIRWTDDGWASWHDAAAWYEGGLAGGREQWGVDILPFGGFLYDGQWGRWVTWTGAVRNEPDAAVEVEYAAWFTCGGEVWWDNNGGANYTLTLTP